MQGRRWMACLGLSLGLSGCFGSVNEPLRHYYTLHLEALRPAGLHQTTGLLRVRDMDAESAYDRFQIVLRQSPYELTYRNKEVWAVKPGRMLSDMLARGLTDQGAFTAVSRELSERRPDFLLSGELHRIEIYANDGSWLAHLALSLQITQVETGKLLWTFHFDQHAPVGDHDFAQGVRCLSQLASTATQQALLSMQQFNNQRSSKPAPLWSPP